MTMTEEQRLLDELRHRHNEIAILIAKASDPIAEALVEIKAVRETRVYVIAAVLSSMALHVALGAYTFHENLHLVRRIEAVEQQQLLMLSKMSAVLCRPDVAREGDPTQP